MNKFKFSLCKKFGPTNFYRAKTINKVDKTRRSVFTIIVSAWFSWCFIEVLPPHTPSRVDNWGLCIQLYDNNWSTSKNVQILVTLINIHVITNHNMSVEVIRTSKNNVEFKLSRLKHCAKLVCNKIAYSVIKK